MKSISISKAKATLSAQLRLVRRGEEIVILDRGRPVARLVPHQASNRDEELRDLEQAGLVRLNRVRLPSNFWTLPRPDDREASVRGSVLSEREEGI